MADFAKLMQGMSKVTEEQEKMKKEQEQKGKAHYSLFFPMELKNKVLSLTAKDVKLSENIKTIVIGTLSPSYEEDMFKKDTEEISEIFGLNEKTLDFDGLKEIKIEQLPGDERAIDRKKAAASVKLVLQELNLNTDVKAIRIIQIGPSHSNFDYLAIEYLLSEWHPGGPTKMLQFITQGDTVNNEKLMFVRSLVVKELVTEVQFMNTQDYNPFGIYLQQGKHLAE